jgi:2-succinyl-5-enolpyruvyl-6-hydroxy-3-cyclohexene-1-carboxylate synthase
MSVAAATMCATLIDEWIAGGVRHAVVAPGSRSTPLVLALAARAAQGDISVQVAHDERVAGFMALGMGLSGVPALVVCTSGTAAANLMPAVVEAGLSEVPMLVLTADRPPELRDVGAAQTVDQTHIFGRAVRWFHDPGVADLAASNSWRSLAKRARDASRKGPVHLNLPFREPLVAAPEGLPPQLPSKYDDSATHVSQRPKVREAMLQQVGQSDPIPDSAQRTRGVILAGGRSGVSVHQIRELAARTGWPIIADPLSEARQIPGAICAADQILRTEEFVQRANTEVIIRIGRPAASKVLAQWVANSSATLVQVGGPGVIDPEHRVAARCHIQDLLGCEWAFGLDPEWWALWAQAEAIAQTWIDEVLGAQTELTEPAIARLFAQAVAAESENPVETVQEIVVASSMPIRDLEWFGGPSAQAHANRGANGIDGTISTALGIACTGARVAVLLGDLAFLHDLNALIGIQQRQCQGRSLDLRILVVDNDGGGIFSFLPQASHLEPETFEQFFGTPHGADLVQIAHGFKIPARTVETSADLMAALQDPGPQVIRVRTDRAANTEVHASLTEAITREIAQHLRR